MKRHINPLTQQRYDYKHSLHNLFIITQLYLAVFVGEISEGEQWETEVCSWHGEIGKSCAVIRDQTSDGEIPPLPPLEISPGTMTTIVLNR